MYKYTYKVDVKESGRWLHVLTSRPTIGKLEKHETPPRVSRLPLVKSHVTRGAL